MRSNPGSSSFSQGDREFLAVLLLIGAIIGASGIVHQSYIGQDFSGPQGHNHLIRTYPESYSYQLTNPPGLYWLGHLVFQHLSGLYYLEILAGFFLLINLTGLLLIYGLIWKMIESRPLRYAAVALITCVPFRNVHAIVTASDTFTLPFFALASVLALRLFENPRRYFDWLGLSLCLSAALYFKYTFVGLFPPLAVLLALAVFQRVEKKARLRHAAIAVVALVLPALVFAYEMRESAKVEGATTNGHWLPKGAETVMRWRDVLLLQQSDGGIFSAPQYFRDQVYGYRKYSYPALLHLSTFTDIQNLFQPPPKKFSANWHRRLHDGGFNRDRTEWSDRLERWAMAWCVPCSVLALLGTLTCGVLSVPSAFAPKSAWLSPATVVVTFLALGFYSPIFLSLHRLNDPYTAGYWLPRLVLPAIVVFLVLGFVLVDLIGRGRDRAGPSGLPTSRPPSKIFQIVSWTLLAHTAVACALFVGFLF